MNYNLHSNKRDELQPLDYATSFDLHSINENAMNYDLHSTKRDEY